MDKKITVSFEVIHCRSNFTLKKKYFGALNCLGTLLPSSATLPFGANSTILSVQGLQNLLAFVLEAVSVRTQSHCDPRTVLEPSLCQVHL